MFDNEIYYNSGYLLETFFFENFVMLIDLSIRENYIYILKPKKNNL
jgi:hypothetical protein